MADRRSRYESHTDSDTGIRFVFAFDADAPDLLHIWVRHLTVPEDAMDAFFDSDARTRWDPVHRRFETSTPTHLLTWFWIEVDQTVMVITCMRQ